MFSSIISKISLLKFLKQNIVFNISALLLVTLSIILSGLVFDRSWDGQSYHQLTILLLRGEWMPLINSHSNNYSVVSNYVNHYPHGIESLESTIYAFTNILESAKAINLLLLFLAFFFCKAALDVFALSISNLQRIIYAVLFTCCPVVVSQITSFYIDGAWYLLLLSIICTLALIISQKSLLLLFSLGMLISLIIPVKINAFFFCELASLIYIIWLLILKDYKTFRRVTVTIFISSLIGLFLFGFHPYVTNTIEHNHPFYPLINPNGPNLDIMTANTPEQFLTQGRLNNILQSFFSIEKDNLTGAYQYASKINEVDVRVGGFGPMFGLMLIISLFLLFIHLKQRKPINSGVAIILVSLFVSIFIFKEGWWARYVPFFWIFPILILLIWDLNSKDNVKKRLFLLLCYSVMLFDIIKCATPITESYEYTKKIKGELSEIKKDNRLVLIDFGAGAGFEEKFKNAGIKYIKVSASEADTFKIIGNLPFPFSPKWKFSSK